jgi:hypothetical protein
MVILRIIVYLIRIYLNYLTWSHSSFIFRPVARAKPPDGHPNPTSPAVREMFRERGCGWCAYAAWDEKGRTGPTDPG